MHFYQFNIGDYAKKTQHLTNEEDLAYRRLLDMYYDTENPVLTSGLATLSRRLRVSEKALETVLAEFFPDGKNKHCDEVIAEYYKYLERQKLNGSKGGRPKHKQPNNPVVSQNNPVPSQLEAISYELQTNVNPLVIKTDVLTPNGADSIKIPKRDSIPYQQVVELYHRVCPMLPRVFELTEPRKTAIRARWLQGEPESVEDGLAGFENVFTLAAHSKFLTGQVAGRDGGKAFKANLSWLMKQENFLKVLEGNYK